MMLRTIYSEASLPVLHTLLLLGDMGLTPYVPQLPGLQNGDGSHTHLAGLL